jgi:protein required for attachment to host cells
MTPKVSSRQKRQFSETPCRVELRIQPSKREGTSMAKSKTRPRHARARMPVLYVLVADGGTARLLRVESANDRKTLTAIATLERPTAHSPRRDLVSDRTGRVFDSSGRTGRGVKTHARHGANSDYDPHAVEVERFAKRIARRLDLERRREGMEELVVIAEPRFLGILRTQLSAPTGCIITHQAAKDLVRSDDARILRTAFALT